MDTAAMLAAAQKLLQAQPFSAHLGMRVHAFSTEGVDIHLPIGPTLLQHHDFVHGGVVAALADTALAFAAGATLGPNVVTSEFKINYVRPARGTLLVARAFVVSVGKRQAVCRCDVLAGDDESRVCAAAQGTIVTLG